MRVDNIKQQVEDILKEKGIPPDFMGNEEFNEKVFKRLNAQFPEITSAALEHIGTTVIAEEMERIGRGKPCRYYKNRKKCTDQGCPICPDYKPAGRWQLFKKKWGVYMFGESIVFGAALAHVLIPFLIEGWNPFTGLIGLFILVIAARLQLLWIYSMYWRTTEKPGWMGIIVEHHTVNLE